MKSKFSRLVTSLPIAALALTGLVAAPAQAAPASATADAVVSVAYSDDLYSVKNINTASASFSKLTFQQWAAMGAPTPTKYAVDYVKYPWQDDIYAVSFFGTNRSGWLWRHISAAEWNRAGNPTARNAGWIAGSKFFKQASNKDEIFVQLNNKIHKLTFKEWVAAESPAPAQYQSEIARLTWQENLAIFNNGLNKGGTKIDFAFWNFLAQPTPRQVNRFPGDSFTKACNSDAIMYTGPTFSGKVSFAQWNAAGQPKPTITGTCATPAPAPKPTYRTCADVRAAGKAPIYRGQPGYQEKFDSDGDGIGCENG